MCFHGNYGKLKLNCICFECISFIYGQPIRLWVGIFLLETEGLYVYALIGSAWSFIRTHSGSTGWQEEAEDSQVSKWLLCLCVYLTRCIPTLLLLLLMYTSSFNYNNHQHIHTLDTIKRRRHRRRQRTENKSACKFIKFAFELGQRINFIRNNLLVVFKSPPVPVPSPSSASSSNGRASQR